MATLFGHTTAYLFRRFPNISWEGRYSPQDVASDLFSDAQPIMLRSFLQHVKRTARGHFRIGDRPNRWSVETGLSKRSFHWRGLRTRHPAIAGVQYAVYVDANGQQILERMWGNFSIGDSLAQANARLASGRYNLRSR